MVPTDADTNLYRMLARTVMPDEAIAALRDIMAKRASSTTYGDSLEEYEHRSSRGGGSSPTELSHLPTQEPVSMSCLDLARTFTRHEQVACVVVDVCGFDGMTTLVREDVLMMFLNMLFTAMDIAIKNWGGFKVQTVCDRYVAVVGLFDSVAEEDIADQAMGLALEVTSVAKRIRTPLGEPTAVTVGLHLGSVTSGIIGLTIPRFQVFGGAVSIATQKVAQGWPGAIVATQVFANATSSKIRWKSPVSPRNDRVAREWRDTCIYDDTDDEPGVRKLKRHLSRSPTIRR